MSNHKFKKKYAQKSYTESIASPSNVQFLSIVTAVVALFTLGGLGLIKLKNPPNVANSDTTKHNTPVITPTPKTTELPQPNHNPQLPPTPSSEQELIYQLENSYELKQSKNLESIVKKILELVKNKKLPTKSLSISLININTNEIAEYQSQELRYPASVAKMFWMVALYGQFTTNKWQDPGQFTTYLYKMMQQSDNNAASHIVDTLTDTKSGENLQGKEYKDWLDKRSWLNRYFEKAGYEKINITQKTYPIPDLNYFEPEGRELQIRENPEKPVRNKITTHQAARLMYEIYTNRAINQESSQAMQGFLEKDLQSEALRSVDPNLGYFNPIRAFFGESLPPNIKFASKAGWTSSTRQEVAYIDNGKTKYILVIFAEDTAYAKDEKIFPEISRLVYEQMNKKR